MRSMFPIMTYIAQCFEIFNCIFPVILVMLPMMKFQRFSWIVAIQHRSIPSTLYTLKSITLQNPYTNSIGNFAIMQGRLSIFFQNIYTDSQIFSPAIIRYDGPAVFRSQFTNTPRPFFSIFRKMLQLFTGNFRTDIFAKIFNEFILNGYIFLSYYIDNISAVS